MSDAIDAIEQARSSRKEGRLFLVATPIGNLEDITLRALRVLREVDQVLAEDTRRTKTLLVHHGIDSQLGSLHAHTPEARVAAIADDLYRGKHYALVTDAGTPLVSDPGRELVAACVARGIAVEAVPGASAVLTALCVAGLPADHFRFVGFVPRSGGKRREALNAIAHDRASTVLFEAPNRLADTLSELSALCGETRRAAVCRELTKLHEEVRRGTLRELSAHFHETAPRGEISLVIEGCPYEQAAADDDAPLDVEAFLEARLRSGQAPRDVAKELATLVDIDKREAYKRVVAHRLRSKES